MAKYRLTVREDVWHTYEIDTDLTGHDEISSLFYDMDPEDQKNALRFSESFCWEVEEVEEIISVREAPHA